MRANWVALSSGTANKDIKKTEGRALREYKGEGERIYGIRIKNVGKTEREYKEYNKETNTKLNIYYAKNRLE